MSDAQAAFCAVLVDEWARAGVTDAVVAPGSRSTPLVMALDAEPRLRVHVVLDERAAGFLALGLGLASGRPAVVATTSGTAAVELHAAVVEAFYAGVPMIAATADRPVELHAVGAPQTIDQEGLFGRAVAWSVSPGVAEWGSAASWRSVASRCVSEAVARRGPVHANLAFRDPLVARLDRASVPGGRPGGAPWHELVGPAVSEVPPRLVELLRAHAGGRGLIVAGGGAAERSAALALIEVARRLGWPVLADPRSGCRLPGGPVVAGADALLRVPEVAEQQPDVVVRLGAPWASKVLGQWLAALPGDVPQVLLDPDLRWRDPDRTASHTVRADGGALAAALLGELPPDGVPTAWMTGWAGAEAAVQEAFDTALAPGGGHEMSEAAVARATVAGVPDGGQLVVASSMPVRDVEWFGAPRHGLTVLSNRGANGIDGVLATAIGAGLAEATPTVALLGDLAFIYDAGALLWARDRELALTVLVVDNDGGGIFSFLPQATELDGARFERYWGTPHRIDPVAVAAAYGVEAELVESRRQLEAVLADASKPGIRVAVVKSDRNANVAAHQALNDAAARSVRARRGR